jgi:His/Glu/Gln/Arg/opine family amino acid ABC transporter permease subunit
MLDGYLPLLLQGATVTISMAFSTLLAAFTVGALAAWGALAGPRAVRVLIGGYTTVARGVPELVLILLVYYGLPQVLQAAVRGLGWTDFSLNLAPFAAGVVTLGLVYGAFMAEVLRAAYLAVPKGQLEAARAVGMAPGRMTRRITLPLMLPICIASIGNIWMVIVKATALMSAIQLEDLMRKATLAANATRKPFSMFLAAAALYLAITLVSLAVQALIEHRLSRGRRPANGL